MSIKTMFKDIDNSSRYVDSIAHVLFGAINDISKYEKIFVRQIIQAKIELIPQQYLNAVREYLGAGAYGAAWLLDNDYVLKISLDPTGKQRAFYRSARDSTFAGTATKQTLNVLDIGELGDKWYYVVMSRLLSPMVGRDDVLTYVEEIIDDLPPGKDITSLSRGEFVAKGMALFRANIPKGVFVTARDVKNFKHQGPRIKKLLMAAYDAIIASGRSEFYDLHAHNYGMLSNDRTTPVFFDPVSEGVHALELEYLRIVERIRRRGNKWVLLSKTGKVLGTHDTKQQARNQEIAVQISKHS